MMMRLGPGLRALALWVLFAPFLVLSFVSSAVMPMQAADGTMMLVLCTGDGPVEMQIDLATGEPVQKSPSDVSDRCDWACGQLAVADLMRPEAPAPTVVLLSALPAAPVDLILPAARVTRPQARGPPTFV